MHNECNLEADIKESLQIDYIAAIYRLKKLLFLYHPPNLWMIAVSANLRHRSPKLDKCSSLTEAQWNYKCSAWRWKSRCLLQVGCVTTQSWYNHFLHIISIQITFLQRFLYIESVDIEPIKYSLHLLNQADTGFNTCWGLVQTHCHRDHTMIAWDL